MYSSFFPISSRDLASMEPLEARFFSKSDITANWTFKSSILLAVLGEDSSKWLKQGQIKNTFERWAGAWGRSCEGDDQIEHQLVAPPLHSLAPIIFHLLEKCFSKQLFTSILHPFYNLSSPLLPTASSSCFNFLQYSSRSDLSSWAFLDFSRLGFARERSFLATSELW